MIFPFRHPEVYDPKYLFVIEMFRTVLLNMKRKEKTLDTFS